MPPKSSQSRGRSQHARNASQLANDKEEPFHPAADAATFRDLLIFEERLKQNAARLQSRKRKYEILLFGFVTFILCLSHFVVISPRSSVFLQYSLAAVLMICLTTLFLFFASGMHAERIRSANKFVPQANRSLRNFNMYLNTRTASSTRWWSIRRLFRRRSHHNKPRPSSNAAETNSLTGKMDDALNKGASVTRSSSRASTNSSTAGFTGTPTGGSSTPRRALSSIPPSQNSRGELIFSNRVSPEFREGYQRYRAAFERRRAEKMAAKRAQSWKRWFSFLLGRPIDPPAKTASSAARHHSEPQAIAANQRSNRTSKIVSRSTRSLQSSSRAGSDSNAGSLRAGSPVEDLSEAASDDGYPPSIASGSSLSGHEPS